MQAKLIGASMSGFAQLLDGAGCERAATDYQDFAAVLAKAGTKTIAVFVKKVLLHWKTSDRPASYPASLKSQLNNTIAALEASKAGKAVVTDYKSLATLCTGAEGAATREFLADVSQAFNAVPTKGKKAATKTAAMNPIKVREIADKLTGLMQDNAGFDAAVAELATPKMHTVKDLKAIADCFLGYKSSHKTKAAIIKAIKSRQLQDAIGASMDRRIMKIAV